MPMKTKDFVEVQPGLKWNKRKKMAIFDASPPGRRKRLRRKQSFESVEAAKSEFAKFRDAVRDERPGYRPGEMPTLNEYVSQHWQTMAGTVKTETFRSDTVSVRKHVLTHLGSMKVSRIGELAIEEFVSTLKARKNDKGDPAPVSAPTINYALRMLRKILHNARKRKLIVDVPRMPFEKERLLRNEFTADEETRYLAAFDDSAGFMRYLAENRVYGEERESKRFACPRRFGASLKPDSDAARVYFSRFSEGRTWFLAALHTGLRRGDVTTLRWSDITLSEGFIRRTTTKTGHEATIPLSETLRYALLAQKTRPVVSSEWAITNADGSPYTKQTIDRYHRIALSIAGIARRVRVHDLRHTFGSALASAGVPMLFIAKALGHASTKMTERYARPSDAAMKAITSALDNRRNGDDVDTRMDTRAGNETEKLILNQQPQKRTKPPFPVAWARFRTGAVGRI